VPDIYSGAKEIFMSDNNTTRKRRERVRLYDDDELTARDKRKRRLQQIAINNISVEIRSCMLLGYLFDLMAEAEALVRKLKHKQNAVVTRADTHDISIHFTSIYEFMYRIALDTEKIVGWIRGDLPPEVPDEDNIPPRLRRVIDVVRICSDCDRPFLTTKEMYADELRAAGVGVHHGSARNEQEQ
jgi:hypothetical protein